MIRSLSVCTISYLHFIQWSLDVSCFVPPDPMAGICSAHLGTTGQQNAQQNRSSQTLPLDARRSPPSFHCFFFPSWELLLAQRVREPSVPAPRLAKNVSQGSKNGIAG